tara:strand:+ start:127 stop:372 length:246 start_codon:yes stop_codon:yes gene_type:complete
MIDKVFMRILMVLGMIFLVALINFTYNYKTYDLIKGTDRMMFRIDKQTGDTWYSFVHDYEDSKWYPFKSNSDYQSWKLNQN